MKLAILMDPIAHLKLAKDTSLAMLHSAQQLGWETAFFTPDDLVCRDGQAFAQVYTMQLPQLEITSLPEIRCLGETALADFDIILMRKDPPFNNEYIYLTYALELAEQQGVLVANKPQSLRDANEKFFTLQFPHCCPPTVVSKNIQVLKDFWKQHQDVIYKPLAGMGGASIFHVDASGNNLSVILEVLTQSQQVTIMAQRYIPEITHSGDKRILLIGGKPVEYGLARIPQQGEFRGNLAVGGQGKVVPLSARDRWICEQIAPTLLAKGLYFVGLDVIGEYLTEINVTSPTCAREIMRETNIDITGEFLTKLAHNISRP